METSDPNVILRSRGRGLLFSRMNSKENIVGKSAAPSQVKNGDTSPVEERKPLNPLEEIKLVFSNIDSQTVSCLDISKVVDQFSAIDGDLSDAIDIVIGQCLVEWRLSSIAAQVFQCLEVVNIATRTPLLRSLQAHCQTCTAYRSSAGYSTSSTGHREWLGAVSLLSQVLSKVRIQVKVDTPVVTTGRPMEYLVPRLILMLEKCFNEDADGEELECASFQLIDVGPILNVAGDRATIKLRELIKERILSGNGSRETRLRLIQIIEGFASEWKSS